jgi:hypothetical protein
MQHAAANRQSPLPLPPQRGVTYVGTEIQLMASPQTNLFGQLVRAPPPGRGQMSVLT